MKTRRLRRHACLSLLALLVLVPTALFASDIALWDNSFPSCSIVDTPGLHVIQVVHRFSAGAVAVRFRIAADPGMNMTYVSETHPFLSLGNVQDGLAVCFNECTAGTTVLATVTYMGYGTTVAPCSLIRVVPPAIVSPTPDMMNCDGAPEAATGTHLEVRPVGSSGCNYCNTHMESTSYPGQPQFFTCSGVPVEPRTWGMIKSLYR